MRVAARIFHPGDPPAPGPLSAWLHAARAALAERHAATFSAAGADAAIVPGQAPGQSFGARLRELAAELRGVDGLVVMGSGALALASGRQLRRFLAAALVRGTALANNRYSADVVAIGGLELLRDLPDLVTDNALPRWLAEVGGFRVRDLRQGWRLGVDLDSPLDIVLAGRARVRLGGSHPPAIDLRPVHERLAAASEVVRDPRAELLVAGRTSPRVLAWLERTTAGRVRAVVEERGLRAGADGSWSMPASTSARATRVEPRAPASLLGMLLERSGPGTLGHLASGLADAALIDTRVLLAARLGRDERHWPSPEDRFASDLLLPERISDPWLQALTRAAIAAPIPILLGGHTLVGPGIPLAFGGWSGRAPRASSRPTDGADG